MSPSIWTQCGARRNAGHFAADVWRVVESQYVTSTRKLVDSDAEQQLLEALIDTAKPPVPTGMASLHYLLSTPFRHPPLRNGSRFGTRSERGIFYAAMAVETALAEVAYYRLVFLAGTTAQDVLGLVQMEHTAFRVAVRSTMGVDLTQLPFAEFEALISSPTDYSHSQALGREMRGDGIEVARFTSARAPGRGANVALLAPAFEQASPSDWQTWVSSATSDLVEMKRKNLLSLSPALSFPRSVFLVGGVLPTPAT